MEDMKTLKIETERLLLVPITMQYAEDIFREFTPEITRYMTPKSAENISETQSFIKSSMQKMIDNKTYQAVILDKHTQEFLGCVGLHIREISTPELGIWIKKSSFGKKIGREAVMGVADRAQKNLDFEYLLYPVDKDNISSRKIAESLGGMLQTNDHGEEIVTIEDTMEPGRIMNSVEYRIPKKLVLPEGLCISQDISDEEFEHMIQLMQANDLSRYIIDKKQFYCVKNNQNSIVAFGRIFDIGDHQSELGSLRVDDAYRGSKIGLILAKELIKDKKRENDLFLATKRALCQYYEKLGFEIITENIPEKLIYTGKWAESEGIDFIIMKLTK